jgi:hypothetical protein
MCRALIPAGFMPDLPRLAHGEFAITICHDGGLSEITIDRNGQPAQKKSTRKDGFCPFAASTVGVLLDVFRFDAPFVAIGRQKPLELAANGKPAPYSTRSARAPPALS